MIGGGHLLVGALALAAAMIVLAVSGRRHAGSRAALALLGVVWLAFDEAFEGGVLVVLAPGRGLTVADLVGLAALAVAGLESVLPVVRRVRSVRRSTAGAAVAPAPPR